jgi:hypothetical protein
MTIDAMCKTKQLPSKKTALSLHPCSLLTMANNGIPNAVCKSALTALGASYHIV